MDGEMSASQVAPDQRTTEEEWLHSTSTSDQQNSPGKNIGLPKISITEARSRNFLVGNANTWGSLLGGGQLFSHFPEGKISVLVGSWNTNGTAVSSIDGGLEELLLPEIAGVVPDVYAIGVQEAHPNRFDWEVALQVTIGLSHVLLHSTSLGTLHLAIFIRRELVWFCSEADEASISTRQGSAVKTKGAVAIGFQLFGTSLLFINSHFTAHDHQLKERILDFEKIRCGLALSSKLPGIAQDQHTQDITEKYHRVFWFGDLNFRLEASRQVVIDAISKCEELNDFRPLLATDQLGRSMKEGLVFGGFQESPISFKPSYKFDVRTNIYDRSEKRRTPAYTDRILFRTLHKGAISGLHYQSLPSLWYSDHKPVYAVFCVHISPGKDNVPLAAGLFARNVYLEAVTKRAALLDPLLEMKGSKVCEIT